MNYDISGQEGNAFWIMGAVRAWCKQLEKDPKPIIDRMMEEDYNNLLRVVKDEFGGMVNFVSPHELNGVDPELYEII